MDMEIKLNFKAIGTSWSVHIPNSDISEEEISTKVKSRIEIFDKTYSRFREDSLVSEISREAGTYKFPDDADKIFSFYKDLYEVTNGLVTPLVGQILVDVGYDKEYSLKEKSEIGKIKKWEDVMEYSDGVLKTKEPIQLDFGALGKGYLVDIVSGVLNENNIFDYTINAGGDILYKTTKDKALRVGLENPTDTKEVIGVAEIINKSICGSAGNKRAWGKHHHIINPETTESPKHISALWTVAKRTILADGLATALFFVKPEKLMKIYDFEYAILWEDNSVNVSKNFPGTFFS